MKKFIVNMVHEELVEVEVTADDEEAAIHSTLRGEYDNWEIKATHFREVVSVEEVMEQ